VVCMKITPKLWRNILFKMWNNVWKNESGMAGRGSLDDDDIEETGL